MDRAVGAESIGDDKTVGVGEFSVGGVEPGRIRSWLKYFSYGTIFSPSYDDVTC